MSSIARFKQAHGWVLGSSLLVSDGRRTVSIQAMEPEDDDEGDREELSCAFCGASGGALQEIFDGKHLVTICDSCLSLVSDEGDAGAMQ